MYLTSSVCSLRTTRHLVQANRCNERGSPASSRLSVQPNPLLTIPTSHSLYQCQLPLNLPLLFRSSVDRVMEYRMGTSAHVRLIKPSRLMARVQTAQAV